MKTIVIYPTIREAQFFVGQRFICGMGEDCKVNIADILATEKPDLAILVGSCGAFRNSGLKLYDTILVDTEILETILSDVEVKESVLVHTEVGKTVFVDAKIGKTTLSVDYSVDFGLQKVTSLTVKKATDIPENKTAQIENMEGFFFFEQCLNQGVKCIELRTVSNFVGDSRSDWHIEEASEKLAKKLNEILDEIDS